MHVQDAPAARGQGVLVGDQHQGRVGHAVHVEHQVNDALSGMGVQVAGGFIGKEHRGLVTKARARATRCCSPPES